MRSNTLIFTTCYNERENIGRLLDEIVVAVPDANILVVDDNSPDNTWDVLMEKAESYPQLTCVQRPRKLGIGSAHKYALFYAVREGYETLVTMDADFSHNPSYIPALLAAHGPNTFVTGSRYCEGGTSDYKGYRNTVSRLGNFFARHVLGVQLRELTTYFRVFDVRTITKLPLRRIAAGGYSYGVQLIYYLRKCGVQLKEVPIHFVDRTHGSSKIPRMQILWSAWDLGKLALQRANFFRDLQPDVLVDDGCPNCGDHILAMKHFGNNSQTTSADGPSVDAYRCTAVGTRGYPPVYICLRCGLDQVPRTVMPAQLNALYSNVEDQCYLENLEAKTRTFTKCFEDITPFLPVSHGVLLEIGAYCGVFQSVAKNSGWVADGLEPSLWAAQYAQKSYGANVLPGFFEDNRHRLRDHYDVVTSWDVLEHVRNPSQFIQECRSILKDNGVLCFSTLDIDNWFPKLLGQRWPWLMDMHLFYFDRHVIKDLLCRNGFELIKVKPYVHYSPMAYAMNGLGRVLPAMVGMPLIAIAKMIPKKLMFPIAFGDIKLYVARRKVEQ